MGVFLLFGLGSIFLLVTCGMPNEEKGVPVEYTYIKYSGNHDLVEAKVIIMKDTFDRLISRKNGNFIIKLSPKTTTFTT